nr:MAG TPA: hypothetical protein [Caudoviricetes sp.]
MQILYMSHSVVRGAIFIPLPLPGVGYHIIYC